MGLKEEKKEAGKGKQRSNGGKSILKKNSVLLSEKSDKVEKELK